MDKESHLIIDCKVMDWNELGAGITIECNNKIELKEEQKIILSVNGYELESVIRRIIPKKAEQT